jgi:flagellar hook-associated protein 2
LEFKEQVTGRNLDVLFEDVPVTDEDNTLEELIEGVVFNIKRSEPGTRVQVNVTQDVDLTLASIKTFVEKYNQVATFVHDQFKIDEKTQKAGKLSAESSLRQVIRSLQSSFTMPIMSSKYQTLAQIGITTNPKSGNLEMDESKVKTALAEDYDSVAKLFIRSPSSEGVAGIMADKIKGFRDPSYGVLKSKMKSYDKIMSNIDEDIERKERALTQKEQALKRQFANLEGRLNDLKGQGDFLSQKFGGGGK